MRPSCRPRSLSSGRAARGPVGGLLRACECIPTIPVIDRHPGGGRGPRRGRTSRSGLASLRSILQIFDFVRQWVPAFPTEPVRGLKAHGKTTKNAEERPTARLEARTASMQPLPLSGAGGTRGLHPLAFRPHIDPHPPPARPPPPRT